MHAVGECVAPFTSAGGHFNLTTHTHKDHSGDFPVLLVNADGTAQARFNTDRFAVAEPDATTLATGDAGARIACGVVEKQSGKE